MFNITGRKNSLKSNNLKNLPKPQKKFENTRINYGLGIVLSIFEELIEERMKNFAYSNLSEYPFTIQQELANIAIHATGIVLGFTGVPVLISMAIKTDSTKDILSACIYGFCYLMVFTFSTLYHSCFIERKRCTFELLDYISIYFLIAGTYTPFILKFMPNESGVFLLSVVWLCSIAGIVFKLFFPDRFILLSVCFYLFMGLLFLFKCQSFFAAMPVTIAWLIISGIVLYVIGVVFFLWQKLYYHHAIWHTLVLIASICHFAAVVLTIRHEEFTAENKSKPALKENINSGTVINAAASFYHLKEH